MQLIKESGVGVIPLISLICCKCTSAAFFTLSASFGHSLTETAPIIEEVGDSFCCDWLDIMPSWHGSGLITGKAIRDAAIQVVERTIFRIASSGSAERGARVPVPRVDASLNQRHSFVCEAPDNNSLEHALLRVA